ncbi:MAG: hypothetical protein ACKVT1_10145 [Dehalococcoidia bacterium]
MLPIWNDGGFPDVDIDWTSNEAVLDFIDRLGGDAIPAGRARGRAANLFLCEPH